MVWKDTSMPMSKMPIDAANQTFQLFCMAANVYVLTKSSSVFAKKCAVDIDACQVQANAENILLRYKFGCSHRFEVLKWIEKNSSLL
jgi:hypothetical protein